VSRRVARRQGQLHAGAFQGALAQLGVGQPLRLLIVQPDREAHLLVPHRSGALAFGDLRGGLIVAVARDVGDADLPRGRAVGRLDDGDERPAAILLDTLQARAEVVLGNGHRGLGCPRHEREPVAHIDGVDLERLQQCVDALSIGLAGVDDADDGVPYQGGVDSGSGDAGLAAGLLDDGGDHAVAGVVGRGRRFRDRHRVTLRR
jgi:hypothetical protein